MSKLAVRQSIRSAARAFATLNGVDFFDTINHNETINSDSWMTAEFYADYTEKKCFSGVERIEHGTADLTVFVKSGIGDQSPVAICDLIEKYFWEQDLSNSVVITDTVPASETSNESRYSGWTVSLEYEHCYRT